ncbi:hypothetical protein IE81DRAFT_105559 [Ceraceosorus guamensis]|uniref:Uncharacterized protein n=1 Tax=Ceraceosorus guamensis TaxID=1522189 RepID=A0A316VLZ7_9BASI|nr:hypothetical protein IE81DRAFT_105559 [Ceraceosorus guamensis]PWN38649.1 hypothetical protein IE81DRAFT_105559 [Ceraceosorus guamensis]
MLIRVEKSPSTSAEGNAHPAPAELCRPSQASSPKPVLAGRACALAEVLSDFHPPLAQIRSTSFQQQSRDVARQASLGRVEVPSAFVYHGSDISARTQLWPPLEIGQKDRGASYVQRSAAHAGVQDVPNDDRRALRGTQRERCAARDSWTGSREYRLYQGWREAALRGEQASGVNAERVCAGAGAPCSTPTHLFHLSILIQRPSELDRIQKALLGAVLKREQLLDVHHLCSRSRELDPTVI